MPCLVALWLHDGRCALSLWSLVYLPSYLCGAISIVLSNIRKCYAMHIKSVFFSLSLSISLLLLATPFDYIVLVDWNINAFFLPFYLLNWWVSSMCAYFFLIKTLIPAWNQFLILKTNMFNLIINSNVAQFHKKLKSFFWMNVISSCYSSVGL